ncbi:MAG: hypothetical protein Q4G69_03450 [Planctomycetia bacterium]|nr:hypothetical protein [Planctomycetia bacterium]
MKADIWILFLVFCFFGCASEITPGTITADQKKETELQIALNEAQKHVAHQDRQNEDLLLQQASLQRDLEEKTGELARRNAELINQNSDLIAKNRELEQQNQESARIMGAQNVSLRKTPSITIIPNNSLLQEEFSLDDPHILPIQKNGNELVIELQDDLLFNEKESKWTLSDSGRRRLFKIGSELLRRYPDRIYRLEGHTDLANPSHLPILPKNKQKDPQMDSPDPSYEKTGKIASFLVENTGVDRNQIERCSCGSACPILMGIDPESNRRNRRVELIITGKLKISSPKSAPIR